MPAATPIPRSPSVLTVYTAADLLTGQGCPVCRYAGESSDRYFAWFALEAHAQPAAITRLSRSLGMCPSHTRRLMSQPGAAARLTVVYRYVVGAARDQLAGRVMRPAPCPACDHSNSAQHRAMDTLLEGLADSSIQKHYRELGGLCIPHLQAALPQARRQLATWLADTMMTAVDTLPSPGWLAGTDHDADVRAVLRGAIPADAQPGTDVCVACLAAASLESEHLTWTLRNHRDRRERQLLLCASHLGDLAELSGRSGIPPLLAWQAGCLTAGITRCLDSSPRWKAGTPATWLRPMRRRSGGLANCAVCLGRDKAAGRELDAFRNSLRTMNPETGWRAPLCVRHLLSLRAVDQWAGHLTARGAVEHADMLIEELNEAFRKGMRAHRHEVKGREMTAWRRAAAFLDGGVFGGGAPRDT